MDRQGCSSPWDTIADTWKALTEWRYFPLSLVALSGLGFSIQGVSIKILAQDTGFSASFQLIFFRGLVQSMLSLYFIRKYNYTNANGNGGGEGKQHIDSISEPDVELFGPTPFVRKMLAGRSIVGYGGIAFAFLGIERLPVGTYTYVSSANLSACGLLWVGNPGFDSSLLFFCIFAMWAFVLL